MKHRRHVAPPSKAAPPPATNLLTGASLLADVLAPPAPAEPAPDPVTIIQPAPGEPAEPTPAPALTVDDLLAARGVTRKDVGYTLRGLTFPWQGWQVDYVVWGDPLVCGFVHEARGATAEVICDIANFPSEAMKAEIVRKLSAVS